MVLECSSRNSDIQLPKGTSCNLNDECTELSCCINFAQLQKALTLSISPDACDMKITAKIEEMTVTKSLFNFAFDTEQIMDLFGILRIK